MDRKKFIKSAFTMATCTTGSPIALANDPSKIGQRPILEGFAPDISLLRALSGAIPGDLPIAINVTKVADTIRPASIVVEGADPNQKMTLARTVYQVEYPEGTIMLDSGMDLETHRTFGNTEEPYYPENYEQVQKALTFANLIIITHYHADHVAGVIRSPNFENIASKVWMSADTADLIVNKPHKATVRLDADKASKFIIADLKDNLPVAPGIVLFKAPGHTTDSKMLFIRLNNGKEFVHSVDSGWSMQNIQKEKMKNASWVNENKNQLLQQYRWLNQLMQREKNVTVICTHDNNQYIDFTARKILGNTLKTS